MSAASRLQYWYWSYWAKPVADRALIRVVEKLRPHRIVELGLDTPQRTTRLIQTIQRFVPDPIQYTGIDPFESRETKDGLPLKSAYRLLNDLGVKPQFFPGDPAQMIPLVANRLLRSDLVIVAPIVDAGKLVNTWSFWPRMLHEQSIVALWNGTRRAYDLLTYSQIVQRAESLGNRKAA